MLKPSLSLAVLSFVLALGLQACQTSDPDPLTVPDGPVPLVSQAKGDSLRKAYDEFGIDSAWMVGDSLFLAVTHGGGCEEHAYALYASDYLLKSNPPQVDLWFHHDGNGDQCLALLYRKVGFDLRQFRGLDLSPLILRIHPHPSSEAAVIRVTYRWAGPGNSAWSFISRPAADSILGNSDRFSLDSARVEGDSLILHVYYGGGCREHVFTPYGSNSILESHPPQIDLWFHHEANGDNCKALIHDRLAFDVRPPVAKLGGQGTLRLNVPGDSLYLLKYPAAP